MAQKVSTDLVKEGFVNDSQHDRGIPEVVFIDKVEDFVGNRKASDVTAKFQELLSKYQYMQSNLLAQKSALKQKLPDIKQALELVEFMIKRKQNPEPLDVTYQLS